MSREGSTRRRLLQVAGTATLVGVAGCGGSPETDTPTEETPMETPMQSETDTPTEEETDTPTPDEQVNFTVRIENTAPTDFYGSDTATGGQIWVTPGAFAVHTTETNPIFTVGESASIGLEALAEAGPPTGFADQPGLVNELPQTDGVVRSRAYLPRDTAEDPNDPMGEVPGAPPIAPGGAFEFTIEAEPGERFSFASMYVPSNDLFLAPETGFEPFDDDDEPIDGEVDAGVGLWDAGTELNGQPGVDPTGAPLQKQNGGANAGRTEGVVQPLSAINDGFQYPDASDAISVQLTPEGDGQFTLRIENVAPTDFYGSDTATGGQIWITPGAFAVHTGEDNPIFTVGEPASIGLEAQAEAGPPTGFADQPGLVDELPQIDRVSSVGAFAPPNTVEDPNDPMGEVPGAPPIAPGGAFEVSLEAEPGERLSFATMYVPSNDLFFSPQPAIPLYDDGEPVEGDVTSNVALWDAGTELNGQPGVDPTSAPLQQQNGGANAGATEGVVRPVSEINDAYEYADPSDVLRVVLSPE